MTKRTSSYSLFESSVDSRVASMNEEPELSHPANPSGLEGIEFVEYATARPHALGHVLELMGFQPVARHRSREIALYRQGTMNVVVNAHDSASQPGRWAGDEARISAVALRARDAAAAYRHALNRGAWAVPTRVEVMELNIPAIHGAGSSRIYFVDRYREFSIYSVDFVSLPHVEHEPPAIAGMRWFGLVQAVGAGRTDIWTEFYNDLFGFLPADEDRRAAAPSRGRVLRSPCSSFCVQLVESGSGAADGQADEGLARVGLAAPDVAEAIRILRGRGVEFVETAAGDTGDERALTSRLLDGVMFELVRDAWIGRDPP